ncbi:MAG: CBS domain-containing protein [Planctomycetaceae bacterium]|nr:CBS domain-containing protein [Planctomycetaceae bacterium]
MSEDEFQDPLENYDPPTYSDPLEEALAQQLVTEIQATPFATVNQETPISEALGKLVGDDIACLLVSDDEGKLVGVFSDRDVLNHVALEFDEVKNQPVRTVMTADPVYVYETDSAAAALTVMAVSGFRHVPVVDLKEHILGIISPQRVTQFMNQYL